ncbi:efflux RND transporter periplasmic adaptor subunit [Clostridium neuense]|uniref:Efflux RND transporter periplasmic adaptor subunit n=1 Tax=Clostridium neuense TaxID=1728934 RepID=A0ABW8TIZ8_9CLOT
MKKNRIMIAAVLAGIMALSVGCGGSSSTANNNKTKKDPNAIQITGNVRSKNVESISLGVPMDVSVGVSDVFVKEGQEVKKGDKLLALNLNDFNAYVNKEQNQIDVENLKKDKITDDDQKKLEQKTIDGLTDELNATKNKLSQSYISGNNIICDMDDAVVTNIGYSKGDTLNSQVKIVKLEDLKNIQVVAKAPEENINDIKEGQSVTITSQAYSGKSYKGKVTYVGKSVISSSSASIGSDSSSGSDDDSYIPVEISIDDNDGKLLPNASVDLEIKR